MSRRGAALVVSLLTVLLPLLTVPPAGVAAPAHGAIPGFQFSGLTLKWQMAQRYCGDQPGYNCTACPTPDTYHVCPESKPPVYDQTATISGFVCGDPYLDSWKIKVVDSTLGGVDTFDSGTFTIHFDPSGTLAPGPVQKSIMPFAPPGITPWARFVNVDMLGDGKTPTSMNVSYNLPKAVWLVPPQGVSPDSEEYTITPESQHQSAPITSKDDCTNRFGPEVSVGGLSRKVEVQRGGAPWEPADDSMLLAPGDRIHTGWKSGATLTFPDGSTLVVQPMSLVSIDAVGVNDDGSVKVQVTVLGEVRAQIEKLPGSRGDFQVRTPTTVASVRGTQFSVFYDGTSTIVSVQVDSVAVTPANGGATVVVPAGKEVSSTASSVSAPVGIGKAGAPKGSVGPAKAVSLFTRATTKGFAACKAEAYSVTLKPAKAGWTVKASVIGKVHGSGAWGIKGKTVKPSNVLARRITAGCR